MRKPEKGNQGNTNISTNMRRIESLASDVFESLLDKLRKAEVTSSAVDESIDDVAQLCLCVRFFFFFWWRMFSQGSVWTNSSGGAHHRWDFIHRNSFIFWGEQHGFGARLNARMAATAPQTRSLHCLIHRSRLCAKLSGELKETMHSVMAIVNFIHCTSGLQHRLFRKLLTDLSAEYKAHSQWH